MDNLKTLMDKRQYELVIKLTKTATSPTDLFYRISALLASGKAEEALKCINDNQKVLETNLFILVKIHIEILCLLNRFDEAREKLKYYEELPYESQQVEEVLRDMPHRLKHCFREERYTLAVIELPVDPCTLEIILIVQEVICHSAVSHREKAAVLLAPPEVHVVVLYVLHLFFILCRYLTEKRQDHSAVHII